MKIIWIVLIGIFAFLIVKFVRLVSKYISSSRPTIDDLKEQRNKFEKEHRDVQEAEYRDIKPDENSDSTDNVNG